MVAMPATQQKLRQARDAQWVDYATVTALKITALRMAWTRFAARDDAQMAEFRHFIAREGESLYWQAAFDALHAYQVKEDEQRWGWPAWPEAYQSVESSAVKQFCEAHREEVEFYLWLQWLAWRQFAACWDTCQSFKLPIGLYRDLAVGVAEGGAETWCDRELYCLKASVGAPPDILGPLGQNWGCRQWTRILLSPGRMSPLSTCCAPICKTAARCALTMSCRCCVCGGYRMAKQRIRGLRPLSGR